MDVNLPPASHPSPASEPGLNSGDTRAEKGATFGHRALRPASEPETSKRLWADTRAKAARVRTLRFRLYNGGGMGGENTNFDILRCWQKLTPGTLAKAEFIYTPKEVPALKALVPGWGRDKAGDGIRTLTVNGLSCDFIPEHRLGSLPIVPFSVVGSSELTQIRTPGVSLRANTCLSLQPLHWIGDNALISTRQDSVDTVKLAVPKDNHLPVEESDILTREQACDYLDRHMGTEPGKAFLIKALISQSEAGQVNFGLIYGLDGSKRGALESPNLILEYVGAALDDKLLIT